MKVRMKRCKISQTVFTARGRTRAHRLMLLLSSMQLQVLTLATY